MVEQRRVYSNFFGAVDKASLSPNELKITEEDRRKIMERQAAARMSEQLTSEEVRRSRGNERFVDRVRQFLLTI